MSRTPSKTLRLELGERRGAADRVEQLVDVPVVHRHHRDDLLREHVERIARIAGRLDARVVHRARDRGAGDQVAAELRHDDPAAGGADGVAGAADALHAARDRRRRLDLDDQIDRAHVDAELERRGGDQAAQLAGLQPVLDLDALRPRERAVVRADQRLAGQLVERRREPLGDAPAVDEDQRRAVRADQLEEPRVDRRPDRGAHRSLRRRAARDFHRLADPRHVLDRHFDRKSSFFFADVSTIVTGRYSGAARPAAAELVVDRFVGSPIPRALLLHALLRGHRSSLSLVPVACPVPGPVRCPCPFPLSLRLSRSLPRCHPESGRPRRADAAWPTGRCAESGSARHLAVQIDREAPRAARATARGARRAWSEPARGSRR